MPIERCYFGNAVNSGAISALHYLAGAIYLHTVVSNQEPGGGVPWRRLDVVGGAVQRST
jgi:hypothetical protein